MSDSPYAGWSLAPVTPAAPAAVDTSAWTLAPAGADWVKQRQAAVDALDERLAKSVGENKPVVDPGGIGAIGHGLQSGLTFGAIPKVEAAVTAGLGKLAGEGDFGDIYQRELAKNRAEGEKLREAHPVLHAVADLAGGLPAFSTGMNPVLAGTLGGGLRAAGESKNVAGEEGTNLRGAAETAGGAAAGGATAFLLPKILGGLGNRFGRKADEAATDAVTFGTQSARDKMNRALEPLGEMVPGERATILKEAGAVGGLRGQRGTLKGIQEAKKNLGEEFGALINQANTSHPGVPVSSVEAHLGSAAEENLANDYMGKVADNFRERLSRVADKHGIVSHRGLQDVLENLNKTASRIYGKGPNNWSEHDAAFISGYRALRNAQAEGLEAATGRNANDVRKYMATMYGLEPVAQKAVNRFEGNDKVGLLGALEKQKGSTSIGHGLILAATGHPLMGAPVVLKGLLGLAKGQFGKSSSPLRNNLATSINLGLQKPLNALSESEMAQLLAAKYAAPLGAEGAGALYDAEAPAASEQPVPTPAAPEVAQALPRTVKRKK